MSAIVLVNPFRCKTWDRHGRLEEYITEESCKSEIVSFTKNGQQIPALGRLIIGDPDFEIEIVCGARRLFVARHLNVPLQVELRELTDRQAAIALEIENHHRRDLSPYERGRTIGSWLATKLFETQEDVAKALGISASRVSRLLKVGRLPSVIVGAFKSPNDICEAWAIDLYSAWDDESKRAHIAANARHLAKAKQLLSASDVFAQLLMGKFNSSARTIRKARDEVVVDDNRRPLFRIKHHQSAISLVISTSKLSSTSLVALKDAVSRVLRDGSLQRADTSGDFPPLSLN